MPKTVLMLLKESKTTHLSAGEICEITGISRAGFLKELGRLEEEGYEIIHQPHWGYKLESVPDRMIPDEIKDGLGTELLGRKIIAYASTASTNDIAAALAGTGRQEGIVVVAEEQTKGRGRFGRNWSSPRSRGIYCSIILKPPPDLREPGSMTLLAAVGAARAIRAYTGLNAMIKWPNDILVAGKKICGILTELSGSGSRGKHVIIGIGVNVNSNSRELPPQASSLKQEAGRRFDRVELLKQILRETEKYYVLYLKRGMSVIIREWRNYSGVLGKRVRVRLPDKTIEGQAMDVDSQGALIVREDNGFSAHVLSGEISMVGPGSE